MKTKSIVGGTIILVCANFISKVLGAILKIPLTYILGEEGMAIYHSAFSVYVTILFLVTSGIPFSLSKYISEALAYSKNGNAKKAIEISHILMLFFGFLGSLILFSGAEFFAMSLKDPKAVLAIRAISPSVFFVAVGCVYKSVFEAYSNMIPTAISQVIESFVKLILGFCFALWLSSFSITYSSCGAIFAITFGELIATIILFILYLPYKRKLQNERNTESIRNILKTLMSIAVPMTASTIISSGFSLLETSIIRNRLLDITFTPESCSSFLKTYSPYTNIFDNMPQNMKINIDGARWLFGAYSGYAATVFNLPIGVLASFGAPIVPIISKHYALGDKKSMNLVISSIKKIIYMFSVPCAVLFFCYTDDILNLLFKNTASSIMLKVLSPGLVIISVSNIISVSLYAAGKIGVSFFNETLASVVKIILLFFLIKIPEINIVGVVISSLIANTILLISNSMAAKKLLGIQLLPTGILVKIFLSGGCMYIMSFVMKSCLYSGFNLAKFISSAIISTLTYFLLLFLFGVISKKEIAQFF